MLLIEVFPMIVCILNDYVTHSKNLLQFNLE